MSLLFMSGVRIEICDSTSVSVVRIKVHFHGECRGAVISLEFEFGVGMSRRYLK